MAPRVLELREQRDTELAAGSSTSMRPPRSSPIVWHVSISMADTPGHVAAGFSGQRVGLGSCPSLLVSPCGSSRRSRPPVCSSWSTGLRATNVSAPSLAALRSSTVDGIRDVFAAQFARAVAHRLGTGLRLADTARSRATARHHADTFVFATQVYTSSRDAPNYNTRATRLRPTSRTIRS